MFAHIVLYSISLLILSLSVYRLIAYYRKTKNYYHVIAKVTGNNVKTVEDPLMGDKHYFSAVVEYEDDKGVRQKMICGEDNPGRPLHNIGAHIKLLVNPDDPSQFLELDIVNGYIIPVFWILVGLAVVLIPAFFPNAFD